MSRKTPLSLFFLLALGFAGCTQVRKLDIAAEESFLREMEAQWVQEFAAKDSGALAAHYAEEAVFMAPGMAPARGKDAIRAMLRTMVEDANLKLTFSPDRVTVAKSGDLAYTQGSWTMTTVDPATKKPMEDKGSYVTVYRKRAEGKWLAVADINTSSVPRAEPAPSR